MAPFADLSRNLRDLAAARRILPTDSLVCSVRRQGLPACLFKWTYAISECVDGYDDVPDANGEGVPTSSRLQEVLLALVDGPKKVDVLARLFRVERPRLYDAGHSLKDLVQLGLITLTDTS
jgi:hypothetical protein